MDQGVPKTAGVVRSSRTSSVSRRDRAMRVVLVSPGCLSVRPRSVRETQRPNRFEEATIFGLPADRPQVGIDLEQVEPVALSQRRCEQAERLAAVRGILLGWSGRRCRPPGRALPAVGRVARRPAHRGAPRRAGRAWPAARLGRPGHCPRLRRLIARSRASTASSVRPSCSARTAARSSSAGK